MENENKNKGYPKRKHKSYFIAPNAAQEKASENATQSDSANPPADSAQRVAKYKNKPKNPNISKQDSTSEQAQSTNTATNEQASKPAQFDNKNRKNKNKHRKHDNGANDSQANRERNDFDGQSSNLMENDFSFSKFDKLEKPAPKKLESFVSSPEYQKYKDYEEFTYDELYGSLDDADTLDKSAEDTSDDLNTPISDENLKNITDEVIEEKPKGLVEVVGIRFKASGKTYYFSPNGINLRMGIHAIVETARGLEYGEVVMANSFISESEIVPPLRPVVRAATQADILHNEEIKELEENAFKICNEKIIAHKLDMKLIDAQYTFDNSKLLFYFTSSGRVDFRELVKDLASVFRTRIELRQIGIRDEAKMVGGLGMCGRPLCCSKFLTDFGQVSIKMAKEQGLSLNSAKISGICGRLMCCLRYEHDTYEYETKRTPPVDTLVRTVDGIGTVIDMSPLQGTIKVKLAATHDVPPKSYKRNEVTILKKKN